MSSPRANRGPRRPAAGGGNRGNNSNGTPPPLLLMNPGKGLTLDAVLGDNVPLLVPTASGESLSAAATTAAGSGGPATPVAPVDLINNCDVEDLQADSFSAGKWEQRRRRRIR